MSIDFSGWINDPGGVFRRLSAVPANDLNWSALNTPHPPVYLENLTWTSASSETFARSRSMKKLVIPLLVFGLGLFVADYFFGVDVPELFEGFAKFSIDLFSGGK
jgi:hypothetical protein